MADPNATEDMGPPDSTNPNELGKWLAYQPLDVQQEYLDRAGNQSGVAGKLKGEVIAKALEDAIEAERSEAFKRGELLPGVNEAGQGTSLNDEGRAQAKAANAEREIRGVRDELPGEEAYTVDPAIDMGPGYDLADKVVMMGEADSLTDRLNAEALAQTRSDTTGIDAQKRALGNIEGALSQGGLDAMDRARIQESNRIRGAQARGAEGAIRADAEEQGRAGGRQSFLLRQQAQQRATGQRAQDDLETQAMALGRRNQLMGAQAQVGNQIQTSQDVIDQFNTQDQRNQRDMMNAGREREWDEGNRRDSVDTGAKNVAVATDYAQKTGRQTANVNRANEAEYFNKGAGGGARGLFRDKLATTGAVADQSNVSSGMGIQIGAGEHAREAASEAAQVEALGGLAGTFGDLATGALFAPEGSIINPKKAAQ